VRRSILDVLGMRASTVMLQASFNRYLCTVAVHELISQPQLIC